MHLGASAEQLMAPASDGRNNVKRSLLLIAVLFSSAFCWPNHSVAEVVLASHKTVHDLVLDRADADSNIQNMRGQLFYDLSGSACRGYNLSTRITIETISKESGKTASDVRSESWEDYNGSEFKFSFSRYDDNKLSQTMKGSARRTEGAVLAELDAPEKDAASFAGDVLFPTQDSVAIMKAASAGQSRLEATVYDGSDGLMVYDTTAEIGPSLKQGGNAKLKSVKNAEALFGLPSWPVVVSYYKHGQNGIGRPLFAVSFRLYDNGVSDELKLDYGTFVLKGDLSKIAFVDPKPCP
jgi:EipB-like